MFVDTDKPRRIRDLYNQTSDIYDNRYRKIQFTKFSEALNEASPEGLILDAGCGTGLFLEFMEKTYHGFIVGIDLSLNMLRIAREKTEVAMLVAGDIEFMPFRNNVFDTLYSFSVLQNLSCDWCGVKEFFRVSRKKSKMIITALSKKYSFYDLDRLVRKACLEKGIPCKWDALFLSMEDIGVCVING